MRPVPTPAPATAMTVALLRPMRSPSQPKTIEPIGRAMRVDAKIRPARIARVAGSMSAGMKKTIAGARAITGR